jgi:neutral ceramidase
MKTIRLLLFITLLLAVSPNIYAGINAGVARKVITPETPVWLSGYASRTRPATEILQDLWAKALVIGENDKIQVIIVTIDIIGLSHELSEDIAQRVIAKYGISRSQLLLNSSHTHSGPVIWPSLSIMFDLGKDDLKSLVSYNSKLADNIVDVIDMAILDLKPANLSVAHGSASIAVNRRQQTDKGVVIGVNPEGHVDNDVPVLKVETTDGKIEALLFGYACHNTTLDTYQINGDYAGFAQIEIEKANQGVTAMYLAGCGADQNPNPRRTVEVAMLHGKTLADAVQKVLSGTFIQVRPPVRTDITTVSLDFVPFNKDKLKEELVGDNRFSSGRASFILMAMDKGYDVSKLAYPVQVIRFSNDFTILALAGEVVVDYSLKAKARYPKENLFVAGYSNEVQCYIPTAKVLKEGGYEPETSMIYYGLPGPFSGNVEEKIFSAIDMVMKKTGAKPVSRKYSVIEKP